VVLGSDSATVVASSPPGFAISPTPVNITAEGTNSGRLAAPRVRMLPRPDSGDSPWPGRDC
jgi:hypothetical protein